MINFNYDIHPPPTWVLTISLTMCWKSPKIFQYIFVIYSPFSSKKCFFSFLSLLVEILKQNFDFCHGNAVECMFAERAQIKKKNKGWKYFQRLLLYLLCKIFIALFLKIFSLMWNAEDEGIDFTPCFFF